MIYKRSKVITEPIKKLVDFVNKTDNVVTLRPIKPFIKVIREEGYPVIGKRMAHSIEACQNPTDKNKVFRKYSLTGIKSDGTQVQRVISLKWQYLIDAPFKISNKCCNYLK